MSRIEGFFRAGLVYSWIALSFSASYKGVTDIFEKRDRVSPYSYYGKQDSGVSFCYFRLA